MSWASVRLEFLRGFMSRAAIRAETGLSAVLQDEILSETYIPTGDVRNWLRNLYERTSYDYLRSTGFSTSQATRFKSYTPDSMSEKADIVSDLIDRLSEGAYKWSTAKKIEAGETFDSESLYNEIQGSVIQGFQTSTKMYEQWIEDYKKVLEQYV